jgi:HEAT repeat protein
LWSWLLLGAYGAAAHAEDDAVLARMLSESPSFRVRARAALALGQQHSERAIESLEAALLDPHVAVRGAAAVGLARIGATRSVPALRAAAADTARVVADEAKHALRAIAARAVIAHAVAPERAPDADAASLADVRYAIVLGEMRDRSGKPAAGLSQALAEDIAHELHKVEQVAVFTLAEMSDEVAQELARRKVPSFRLEGNLSRLDDGRDDGDYRTRCEVSLLLMDEPERTLRGLLKGAAVSSEQPRGQADAQQIALARRALQSAVRSALSSAAEAIEAAALHRDLGMGDVRAEASLEDGAGAGRARR